MTIWLIFESHNGCEIIVDPPMEDFSALMSRVIDFPPKLSKLMAVDAALVPFITLDQRQLCTPETCGPMYAYIEETKKELEEILKWGATQPQALLSKYEEYDFILKLDPKEFARKWFDLPEKVKDRRVNTPSHLHRSASNRSLNAEVASQEKAKVIQFCI